MATRKQMLEVFNRIYYDKGFQLEFPLGVLRLVCVDVLGTTDVRTINMAIKSWVQLGFLSVHSGIVSFLPAAYDVMGVGKDEVHEKIKKEDDHE